MFHTIVICLILPAITNVPAAETGKAAPIHRNAIFTESGSEDCLRCHSGEKIRGVLASPHLDSPNPNAPVAIHGCESCHGPGSIHISRAHGGQGFPPLTIFGRGSATSPRDEQLQACLSCHALGGMGVDVIGFVGSPHDRRTINCSTCHQVHVEDDPISDRESQAKTCNRCHRRHMESHPRFEDKSIDFDNLSCATCHDVHIASVELD